MDDPGPATGPILQLLLLFLLILMNAFFAMSEIAIITLNNNKISRMADEGNKKAKQVIKLTANSSHFLSTIQIGITLAGFLTSASASRAFVDELSGLISKIPYVGGIGQGVISVSTVGLFQEAIV